MSNKSRNRKNRDSSAVAKSERQPPTAGKPVTVQRQEIHQQVTRTGPIPAPDELAEYEKFQPGLGALIVTQWQDESKHRRKIEQDSLEFDRDMNKRGLGFMRFGQILGFLGLISIIVLAWHMVSNGHAKVASATVIATAAAISTAFVWGRKGRDQIEGETRKSKV